MRELQDHYHGQYKACVTGFVKQFEVAAFKVNGPHDLPKDWFHLVDSAEKIYEFVKGDLRLLCFIGEGAIVICSSVSLKKRRKVDPQEVGKAVRLKKEYLAAKERNAVVTVSGEFDALHAIR